MPNIDSSDKTTRYSCLFPAAPNRNFRFTFTYVSPRSANGIHRNKTGFVVLSNQRDCSKASVAIFDPAPCVVENGLKRNWHLCLEKPCSGYQISCDDDEIDVQLKPTSERLN